MTTRHTISHADELYRGNAYLDGYSPDGRRGVLMSHLHNHRFLSTAGASPSAGGGNEIFSAYATPSLLSASGGNWISAATGTIATAGSTVINFDIPRNIQIKTCDTTALKIKIHGRDVYGQPMAETIITATADAFASGQRCFKYIDKIYATAGMVANALSIGYGNRLGLPFHLQSKNRICSVAMDGKVVTSGGTGMYTVYVGASSATTITTSNGSADARGSILFSNPALDGSKQVAALIDVDASTQRKAFGVPQVSSCTNG